MATKKKRPRVKRVRTTRRRLTYAEVLGEVLHATRKHSKLSQSELAEACGVSQTRISRVERGQSALSVIEFAALCEAMSFVPSSILQAAEKRWESML